MINTGSAGGMALANLLIERSCVLLEQIIMQLDTKSSYSSFRLVKRRLDELKQQVLGLACQ